MVDRMRGEGSGVSVGLLGWLCLLVAVGVAFTSWPYVALVPAAIGGALVAADRVQRRR